MPAGVETPAETVAKFRAAYLLSGNAYGAAREVGIPESTGAEIARRFKQDPEFIADRRLLRETYRDELVEMRMHVARVAMDRFENGSVDESNFDGKNVTIIDKRYEFGKLVLDAEKNSQHLQKLEGDNDSDGKPTAVNINITAPDGADVSVD